MHLPKQALHSSSRWEAGQTAVTRGAQPRGKHPPPPACLPPGAVPARHLVLATGIKISLLSGHSGPQLAQPMVAHSHRCHVSSSFHRGGYFWAPHLPPCIWLIGPSPMVHQLYHLPQCLGASSLVKDGHVSQHSRSCPLPRNVTVVWTGQRQRWWGPLLHR